MAEVLSPLFSQNDMLQTRPSSSDNFSNSMSSGQSQQTQQRILQMPRSTYGNHSASSGYRGTSSGPVTPYAFKSTPTLKTESRTSSAPGSSSGQRTVEPVTGHRQRYPAPASISTSSSSSSAASYGQQLFSKDDSVISSNFQIPPFTTTSSRPLSMTGPTGSLPVLESPMKPSPDRYRRGHRRSDSNISTGPQDQSTNGPNTSPPGSSSAKQDIYSPTIAFSNGDVQFTGQPSEISKHFTPAGVFDSSSSRSPIASESAKRYRRKSQNSLDTNSASPSALANSSELVNFAPSSPSESVKAVSQNNSRPTSATQDNRGSSSTESSPKASSPSAKPETFSPVRSYAAVTAASRRLNNPSPLSQPAADAASLRSPDLASRPVVTPPSASPQSPAIAAMAALNDKDAQKGMKSRLRRAFSFGSSAELRRAAGENTVVERARLRKEQFSNELDDEQDAIAKKQEASGLGNSIYSGQGNVFPGSTDNLSISSTASSASLMLRKMGKGMKKGGKSIKGLFRPKSVIGVPAADGPLAPSVGAVSMVTVEAEREKVNVNADPHTQAGGGTGFPRLERNSIDQARNSIAGRVELDGDSSFRRGIVGGDQERAEVLAAVRKGILKRSTTGSPNGSPALRPVDGPSFDTSTPILSNSIERRGSPVPSVTSSEPRRTGHRRTDSIACEGEDYFGSLPRIPQQSTRSLPGTPRSLARNISFSPRLQFHDAWSSSEYDRRGDIATCNRLTPMLAQQIKEELNTFKMEMEVHEASKPHTHFF